MLRTRRKDKLRNALLRCFGAFSLQVVETAVEQADELFERFREDFTAVYQYLCASIQASLPKAAPLPSQPSNWKGLLSHQAQVHRLFALHEDLLHKHQQTLYREELNRQIETKKAAEQREFLEASRLNQSFGTKGRQNSYQGDALVFGHYDAAETRRRQVCSIVVSAKFRCLLQSTLRTLQGKTASGGVAGVHVGKGGGKGRGVGKRAGQKAG